MAALIILNGLRSIEECMRINPSRISKILVSKEVEARNVNPRLFAIKQKAIELGIKVEQNPKASIEEPLLAVLKEYQYADFGELRDQLKAKITEGKRPVILALDGITDTHNLGAIIRTAAFMGVAGIILPKDRSALMNDAVYRIASGGVEHVQLCLITNLVSALKELKEIGYWCVAFSEHSKESIDERPCDFAPVLVIGNEEKGVRQLVLENCDFNLCFSPKGNLKSLNASVAAALSMSWATKN